jgi:iron complex outermembrane receptor protein
MKKLLLHIILALTATCSLQNVNAQTDTAAQNSYEGLSLKALLDIKIVSASKKLESLFDAPFSASVLSREEIARAGCTSIMEALRMVPGMIVREQSNGNYDIHLRGMDNVPPDAPFDVTSNTTTLVMIDNRPVYSYLRGGTFWETLPVDLNDVEKIEVVRGPAAAIYGPNAVNGVINIITRQVKQDGLYATGASSLGAFKTLINNASIGFRKNNWNVIASGNYQHRDRTQTSYFEYFRNSYLENPDYFRSFVGDTARNVSERYPEPGLAMEKYAGNLFVNYNPGEKISFNLSTGIQHSKVQKVSTENAVTPLSIALSDSRYASLQANYKKFSARVSYDEGTQITDLDPGNQYDFRNFDVNAEYNYTKGNLSVKPGLSYRNAIYDDTRYSDVVRKKGMFNARGQITTFTPALRAEYSLFKNKLRLIAAISANRFNYPDTTYLSYQFAATYKLNKKHLFRVVLSRAQRSSTVFDTYVDQTVAYFPSGYKKFTKMALQGNRELRLMTAGMIEIGYRALFSKKLNIDVELFSIQGEHYNTLIYGVPYFGLNGTDTVITIPIQSTVLPLHLHQAGITISATWTMSKLQIKPFITIQETKALDYYRSNMMPAMGRPVNIYSGMGTRQSLESTPTAFGGASVNYTPVTRLNVTLNAYYYTKQTYYHLSNILLNDGVRGIDHIPAKLLLNANITYEPTTGIKLFCTGRNLLNDTSREFFKTDRVPFTLLGGIHFEL